MKKFILHSIIFFAILVICMVIVYLLQIGQVGRHYERFSSPQAYSLILGSSMAASDIDPAVVDSVFQDTHQLPIYNYSFAIHTSPYGETYSKSVFRKLKSNSNQNSLFILAVDPFSIGNILQDVEGESRREDRSFVGKMYFVHHKPNLEYLIRFSILNKKFYRRTNTKEMINSSGRYISRLSMDEDSSEVLKRFYDVILPEYYEYVLPTYTLSEERVESLIKLIRYLKEQGEVYLVRLPVGPEYSAIMDSIYPSFDQDMKRLTIEEKVSYINFRTNNLDYRTTDGVHLYNSEGTRMTHALCDSIKVIRNEK